MSTTIVRIDGTKKKRGEVSATNGLQLPADPLFDALSLPVVVYDHEGSAVGANAVARSGSSVGNLLVQADDFLKRHALRTAQAGEVRIAFLQEGCQGYRVLFAPTSPRSGPVMVLALFLPDDLLGSEESQWYREALEAIGDTVLICDQDYIIRFINPAFTKIKGPRPEEIVGRKLHDVRPAELVPKVMQDGKPITGVHRVVGGVEYIASVYPIIRQGNVVGAISIGKDITEVRRLASKLSQSEETVRRLRSTVLGLYRARYTFEDIVGWDRGLSSCIKVARKAAASDANVLILGETGTGKELIAHAIHSAGPRSAGPFVPVNCAAIPANLLESELFGYEEGSFTGAKKGGKVGLFEVADGGTIFLDEIGELALELQC